MAKSLRLITFCSLIFFLKGLSVSQIVRIDSKNSLYPLAQKFVEARNESDPKKRISLLNAIMGGRSFPKTASNEFISDLYRAGGSFQVHAIYSLNNEAAIHIIGKETKTNQWMRYQLGLVRTDEVKIGLVAQTPSRQPIVLPQGTIQDNVVTEFIESDLDEVSSTYGFSAGLLIMEDGKRVVEKYVGLASEDPNVPLSAKTAISMASGSKMFMSVLIGQAIEEGKLSWDLPISDFVPELRKWKWSSEITIQHLLSHSSGLQEYWDEVFDRDNKPMNVLTDYLPYFADKPLEFTPGTSRSYVNTNFIVLGLILEAIYDAEWKELVSDKILRPLDMENTFFTKPKGLSYYQELEPGNWLFVNQKIGSSPAGGIHATVNDLAKFGTALMDGSLLSQETMKLMLTNPGPSGLQYGLGFELSNGKPFRYGHGGRGPGHHFAFKIYPETKRMLVFMTNRAAPIYLDLLLNIATLTGRE